MEPIHKCGYEGAKGKLYEDKEEARKSLRIEEIEKELKTIRESIEHELSYVTQYMYKNYQPSRMSNYSYPPPTTVVHELLLHHPEVVLSGARIIYDISLRKERLEKELYTLTNKYTTNPGFLEKLKAYFSK